LFALTDTTIAILPFVNMSSSQENEYFSDGITEEIINALAKLPRLKVTSRTSSFYFKNKDVSIPEVAKALNVSTILEGSVRVSGNTLRITAQLIQANEDYHFWSETWDRSLNNIFEVQDEISLLIADKLREHLGHFDLGEQLVNPSTESIDAYQHCLKAKYFENQWNPEASKKAIVHYKHALQLDPEYAVAYLGLANCYSFLGTTASMAFAEAWEKTAAFTQKAYELNSDSSGVYYQRANLAFFVECEYSKSLKEIKKAIEINPNNAEAQQFASFLYIISGAKKQAVRHLDIALDINPLSDETHFFRAYFHYIIGAYEKALVMLNQCLEANNKGIPAHSVKTLCLLKLKCYKEVLSYYDTVAEEAIVVGEKLGSMALAYALMGNVVESNASLSALEQKAREPNGFTEDAYCFMMYAVQGELDKAFGWVDKAIEQKSALAMLRYGDPLVDSLRADPRYLEYSKKLFPTDTEELSERKTVRPDLEKSRADSSKIVRFVEETKAYLEPSVSLRSLARQVELHPNYLSWLLNSIIGKNFNEFINHYRIEAFKTMAKNPGKAHLSIEGLAYESGFSSKTAFNTYFKKEVGLTPSQFLKQ